MEGTGANDHGLATWIGALIGCVLERGRELETADVVLARQVPYRPADLAALLLPETRVYVDELPDDVAPDLVILGQQAVGEELLDKCMAAAHLGTRFLPQEGFLDLMIFGFDWWTEKLASYLNHACDYYPPLAYVRQNAGSQADFEWPSVEATPAIEPHGSDAKDRAEQTELYMRGYNVAKDGPSREERWLLLRRIIEGREMTLRDVAGTIASHCRARRRQHDGEFRFARALQEWEYDLRRLKATYYDPGRYRWSWPSVRP